MSYFVKVIMHNFTQVYKSSLLDLNLDVHIDLYSWSVDYTQISNVILVTFLDYHELALPKFLVISDLVVVTITLTNFKESFISINKNFCIF